MQVPAPGIKAPAGVAAPAFDLIQSPTGEQNSLRVLYSRNNDLDGPEGGSALDSHLYLRSRLVCLSNGTVIQRKSIVSRDSRRKDAPDEPIGPGAVLITAQILRERLRGKARRESA